MAYWGSQAPLNLGPHLLQKFHVPLNLSGRTLAILDCHINICVGPLTLALL